MRNTKLIFVEGLPGLGKTTTAATIASRLQSEAVKVNLFLETQPGHPLNVGGDLHPAGNTTGAALFLRYNPTNFAQESLQRWEAFVHTAMQSDSVSVLDSFPFQNSIRVLLQMDAGFEFMRDYADRVEALVLPLQPVLIYFNLKDVSQATDYLNHISTQRGKAWTDYVIELVTDCPYARSRKLEGFNGVLTFIGDYKQVMDSLLSRSRLTRLVLESCSANWELCYQQIAAFLEITM